MGKGGGSQHTPYEQPDNLISKQKISIIDCLGEGPIEGPVNGLQSVLLKMTPAVDAHGNSNVNGMNLQWVAGENEQPALSGFEGSGVEVPVNTEIKHSAPLTRTITATNIDRLRFTFGVAALVEARDNGDRVASSVAMQIQIQRDGVWVTERNVTISGKTSGQYLNALVIDNLPPRPFNVRMVRATADSTSDRLQNKTLWASYTEIIDVKQRYPNTAVVGLTFDSEQFGSELPARNYHIRGRIVQVPSNYDPATRAYTGIWDGAFKPAYTDNPAWCLYDMLTHPRYGLGRRIGLSDVDKWALYTLAQYADTSVPNGYGGTEPRMTCNGYITTKRSAYDVINDFCSIMRCMPVWNGTRLTFVQDRPADKVWTYTNANVVNGDFTYTFSPKKSRHNAVLVRWINPDNGWQEDFEYVSDDVAIAEQSLNQLEVDAFCCTSRGQAHRLGLWILTTEKYEIQTVGFKVAAEGLRHLPGDIFEVADNDYAASMIGGRILFIDANNQQVTLDRAVTLPSGKTVINLVAGDGQPVKVEVRSQLSPDVVVLKTLPVGIKPLSVWSLTLPSLRPRYFRCLSIKEDKKSGTYEVVALQHVPEKEAIVDNGASFEPKPGTGNSTIPPAVEHLTVEVTPNESQYQAVARWDTPRVVSGVRFELKLNLGDRVVGTQTTSDREYRFTDLPLGEYTLMVRALNSMGQRGDPSTVTFMINAPEAPAFIELTPGYFQITVTPRQSYYQSGTRFDFWFSEKRITDIRLVESLAQQLGIASYWVKDRLMKLGTDYFFYVRSVNTVGKSAFVEAIGQVNSDAEGVLDILKDQITNAEINQNFFKTIDNTVVEAALKSALEETEGEIKRELTQMESGINKDINAKITTLNQTISTQDKATAQKINLLETKTDKTNSKIGEVEKSVTRGDSALAESIKQVSIEVGNQKSAVEQVSKAQTNLKGDVEAIWSLKVQTMSGNKQAIAGIQATAEGEIGQVLILADRFAVMNPNNGSVDLPFVIQNGQIIMDEAFMKSLNINGRFIVTPNGELSIRANANSNVGLKMNSSLIQINDEKSQPAVKLGYLNITL